MSDAQQNPQNKIPNQGRVSRRADRYDFNDERGQYPRPRQNAFAQEEHRTVTRNRRPQPMPQPIPQPIPQQAPRQAERRAPEPQYEQPASPYVPGFMRNTQGTEPTFQQSMPSEKPIQQTEYLQQQTPYVVMSEKNTQARTPIKQRTLIVFTSLAVVLLIGAWIAQLLFTAQTQAIFATRTAAAETIADQHPYRYQELIEAQAEENNIHPAFVAAIVLNESSFDPNAESYRGARGLMQMMPDTASWIFDTIGGATEYSFDLMYTADLNVMYGCWYLNYLSDRFQGDPVLVAAAFHSGQTNVINWLNNEEYSSDQQTIALENLPDGNTKDYVRKVLDAFAVYRQLYYDEVDS